MNSRFVLAVFVLSLVVVGTWVGTADATTQSLGKATGFVAISEVETGRVTANTVATYWGERSEFSSENVNTLLASCRQIEGVAFPQSKILPRHATIESAAQEMVDSGNTEESKAPVENVFTFFDFTASEVTYRIYTDWRDAIEVLESRTGDCTDKSILLVSLLKNRGHEAYVAYSDLGEEGNHAWVVAQVGSDWIQLDPTISNFDFVPKCLETDCEYAKYYRNPTGLFNNEEFLECN